MNAQQRKTRVKRISRKTSARKTAVVGCSRLSQDVVFRMRQDATESGETVSRVLQRIVEDYYGLGAGSVVRENRTCAVVFRCDGKVSANADVALFADALGEPESMGAYLAEQIAANCRTSRPGEVNALIGVVSNEMRGDRPRARLFVGDTAITEGKGAADYTYTVTFDPLGRFVNLTCRRNANDGTAEDVNIVQWYVNKFGMLKPFNRLLGVAWEEEPVELPKDEKSPEEVAAETADADGEDGEGEDGGEADGSADADAGEAKGGGEPAPEQPAQPAPEQPARPEDDDKAAAERTWEQITAHEPQKPSLEAELFDNPNGGGNGASDSVIPPDELPF